MQELTPIYKNCTIIKKNFYIQGIQRNIALHIPSVPPIRLHLGWARKLRKCEKLESRLVHTHTQ